MKNLYKIIVLAIILLPFQAVNAFAQESHIFKIANPPKNSKVKIIAITVRGMQERMDPNYLGMQIRLTGKPYFGLEGEATNPTTIKLYMSSNEPVDEAFLKSIVEKKELNMPVHGGGNKLINLNFEYAGLDKKTETITSKEFLVKQFEASSKKFNKNTEKWGGKNEAVYEIEFPSLDKPLTAKNLPYFFSHLSLNDGFLKVETLVNENEQYAFRITYSKDVLNDSKIWDVLTSEKWSTVNREGEILQIDPKFSFTAKGATITK